MTSPTPKDDTNSIIRAFLDARAGSVSLEDVATQFPRSSPSTVKQRVRTFLSRLEAREYWGRVVGVRPAADTILDAVESDMGHPIRGADLCDANLRAKAMVDAMGRPSSEHFLRGRFAPHIVGDTVSVPFAEMERLLRERYSQELTRASNGLVSVAGTLNQSLLVRALRNEGLSDTKSPRDFLETGDKSQGDIQIYHYGPGGNRALAIEAKSYAARERLLRGLQDIQEPKVGVGFFTNASEFNPARTDQFIKNAHTSAIYLPRATLGGVDAAARRMAFGSKVLYRSLEDRFAADMRHFTKHGDIPDAAS